MYVTLFGDRRGTLPAGWINETIIALLGDARIDATGTTGTGARMTFLGLAGDAIVIVPPGRGADRLVRLGTAVSAAGGAGAGGDPLRPGPGGPLAADRQVGGHRAGHPDRLRAPVPGVETPTDVLVGVALGVAIPLLGFRLFGPQPGLPDHLYLSAEAQRPRGPPLHGRGPSGRGAYAITAAPGAVIADLSQRPPSPSVIGDGDITSLLCWWFRLVGACGWKLSRPGTPVQGPGHPF
jgi:hypothetical protein